MKKTAKLTRQDLLRQYWILQSYKIL